MYGMYRSNRLSGFNTDFITGLGICEVYTQAVDYVILCGMSEVCTEAIDCVVL